MKQKTFVVYVRLTDFNTGFFFAGNGLGVRLALRNRGAIKRRLQILLYEFIRYTYFLSCI